jgi:DNA-binding NtrC family response regulator
MINQKKIALVLEDERSLLEAIKIKLEKNNYEVISSRNMDQAKEFINKLPKIDVIWLDHYLIGKGDGLDFIVWCKQETNVKCNSIPIFVVSNSVSSNKIASYVSLGATKFFVKSNHKLDEIIKEIDKSLK